MSASAGIEEAARRFGTRMRSGSADQARRGLDLGHLTTPLNRFGTPGTKAPDLGQGRDRDGLADERGHAIRRHRHAAADLNHSLGHNVRAPGNASDRQPPATATTLGSQP